MPDTVDVLIRVPQEEYDKVVAYCKALNLTLEDVTPYQWLYMRTILEHMLRKYSIYAGPDQLNLPTRIKVPKEDPDLHQLVLQYYQIVIRNSNSIYCDACQVELPFSARFCIECGAPVRPTPVTGSTTRI